ncbi:MAG: hypothetical protein BGP06_20850 [Rhizobiales bacterium 65-9]|nr:hypothetical protein [Hyphomicrobiales bacterium]OJY36476.1 MAG: hypothetical protein BGP06_20850 [Rhizobiales bacterium 65-9]
MQVAADLFTEIHRAPRSLPQAGFDEAGQAAYSSLQAKTLDSERFCAWRGLSGQRYVTSIYRFADCPDYENVVALAVRRDGDGRRTILAGLDLGAFPIVALNGETMRAAREQGANEIHLHLLADTPAARAAAIDDLL